MFQAAGIGPVFGQAGYFLKLAAEKFAAAIDRLHTEAQRNMRVLDGRLAEACAPTTKPTTRKSVGQPGRLRQN